jgi:hypothetical protein
MSITEHLHQHIDALLTTGEPRKQLAAALETVATELHEQSVLVATVKQQESFPWEVLQNVETEQLPAGQRIMAKFAVGAVRIMEGDHYDTIAGIWTSPALTGAYAGLLEQLAQAFRDTAREVEQMPSVDVAAALIGEKCKDLIASTVGVLGPDFAEVLVAAVDAAQKGDVIQELSGSFALKLSSLEHEGVDAETAETLMEDLNALSAGAGCDTEAKAQPYLDAIQAVVGDNDGKESNVEYNMGSVAGDITLRMQSKANKG